MKNFKQFLLSGLFLLSAGTMLGQGKIKGKVTDSSGPVPGANVVIKGSTTGTSTDFDGKFVINATTATGTITVSSVGYQSKTVAFTTKQGETTDLGTISLSPSASDLDEVIVKNTLFDIAKERKTPVAVSTIKAAQIQSKLGNNEFVEILKNTPSVYASKAGGGFGDSRITIRGFGQENIAVMINGMPVNDMENGRVFWSNWAGLSDVASAMRVQRGLGSSRLAISSVGGTINIVTKSSQRKEGGQVATMIGNDNYRKFLANYSTGKLDNGLSASVLLSSTRGDGFVDGTKFESQNYFIGLGYSPNDKHNIEFTFTGAPQWHHQRGTTMTIQRYIAKGSNGDPNVSWNEDWGYYKGEEFNLRRNFYHKPVGSLNWEWKISDKTKLNTMVYGSWGRGGGSGAFGNVATIAHTDNRLRDANGLINFDLISKYNAGQSITTSTGTVIPARSPIAGFGNVNTSSSGLSMISGINSHNWYGGIMNLNQKIGKLTLDGGVDFRTYKGIHVRNLNNLIGADYYRDQRNINNPSVFTNETSDASASFNPFYNATANKSIDRDWDGLVNWMGGFAQAEYATDKLTLFLQGAVSNQSYQRVDRFVYKDSDPLQTSEKQNRIGGNIKAGANFNINDNHNVFVNSGYYSRQPFIDAVFPNSRNVLNDKITNEKILGIEAGYGFKNKNFNANLNIYRTEWNDRFTTRTDPNQTANPQGYFVFNGVSQLHQGVELDFNYKPLDKLKLNGMFSFGDWKYVGNSTGDTFNNQNELFPGAVTQTVYIDGARVGSAAQMTASFGAEYEVVRNLKVNANTNFFDNLYADINPANFSSSTNKGTLKLPSYQLFDAGFEYALKVGKTKNESVNFICNVDNLFNKIYIQESSTNIFADDFITGTSGPTYQSSGRTYNGVADANRVWFGFGRTWNFGITYKF